MFTKNINYALGDPINTLGFPNGGVKSAIDWGAVNYPGEPDVVTFPTGGVKSPFGGLDVTGVLSDISSGNINGAVSGLGNTIGSLVGVPILGDIISGLGSAFGLGPDDWADVEARFKRDYIDPTLATINARLSAITEQNALAELTDIDRWLGFMSSTERYRIPRYGSQNSKQSAELIAKTFDKVKANLRAKFAPAFTTTSKVENDLSRYAYKDARGHSNRQTASAVQYFQYVSIKKSIPQATVDTGAQNQGKKTNSKGYEFRLWHLLLLPIVPLVYLGVKWFKNKK